MFFLSSDRQSFTKQSFIDQPTIKMKEMIEEWSYSVLHNFLCDAELSVLVHNGACDWQNTDHPDYAALHSAQMDI